MSEDSAASTNTPAEVDSQNQTSGQKRPLDSSDAPVVERKRKRRSGWDTPAEGADVKTAPTQATPTPVVDPVAVLKQQQELMASLQTQLAAQAASRFERRLYVGSLYYDLNEEHVRAAFSMFGPIVKIDMPREPLTGKSKGFCFVEYSTGESAQAALLTMNGFLLGGRPIKVGRTSGGAGGSDAAAAAAGPATAGVAGFSSFNPAAVAASVVSTVASTNPALLAALAQAQLGAALTTPAAPLSVPIAIPAAAAAAAVPTPVAAATTVPLAALAAVAAAPAPAVTSAAVPSASANALLTTPILSAPKKNRIYVGSISYDLTSDQLKSVFEPFGRVRSCQLIPNPETGKHRGYGFIEFEEEKGAQDAITTMDNFELFGRQLKVNWANATGVGTSNPMSSSPSAAAVSSSNGALLGGAPTATGANAIPLGTGASSKDEGDLNREENLRISATERFQLMQRLSRDESRVIALKNMVDVSEASDPNLEEEVKEECSKHGPVEKVVIKVHTKPAAAVTIYASFVTSADAAKARQSLDRRFFGGRIVRAEYYPVAKFEAGILEA